MLFRGDTLLIGTTANSILRATFVLKTSRNPLADVELHQKYFTQVLLLRKEYIFKLFDLSD